MEAGESKLCRHDALGDMLLRQKQGLRILVGDVQSIQLLPDVSARIVLLEVEFWPLMNVPANWKHPRLDVLSLLSMAQPNAEV